MGRVRQIIEAALSTLNNEEKWRRSEEYFRRPLLLIAIAFFVSHSPPLYPSLNNTIHPSLLVFPFSV